MPVAAAKLMCLRNQQEKEEMNSGPTEEQLPTSSPPKKSNQIKTLKERTFWITNKKLCDSWTASHGIHLYYNNHIRTTVCILNII